MGRLRGFLPNRWPFWFSPRLIDFEPSPLGPFPRSLALTDAGDVCLVPTEGHTAGHLSVIVQSEGVSLFLAGDASYTQGLMLEGVVDGVSPDETAARRTLQRISAYVRESPSVYLPAHDPGSGERFAARDVVTA